MTDRVAAVPVGGDVGGDGVVVQDGDGGAGGGADR